VVAVAAALLVPALAEAAGGKAGGGLANAEGLASNPLTVMTALSALSLLPFVVIITTSFVKIAVVLSMVRQALGMQQTPPTQVITGLAIVLTAYVMHPVALEMARLAESGSNMTSVEILQSRNPELMIQAGRRAQEPLRTFMAKHSHKGNVDLFYQVSLRLRDPRDQGAVAPHDFIVLLPAFVMSELTEAFQIGFVIFIPFLMLDMVVGNILMALGMQMLSPATVGLPFKVMLFVMVDGWVLLTRGLVLSYQ